MPDPVYQTNDLIAERYIVQKLLGAGAFAYVYRVLDEHLSQLFALKLLRETTDALKDLRQEFAILSVLNHSHIARIFDAGELPDHSALYLKLEYIEGSPLDTLIEGRRISLASARQITNDLLDALGYLHSNNILHRDIKPSNILTSARGAVIVDFNIAKSVELQTESQSGTLPYMPPEVYSSVGWTRVGDLYCVGEVLYEMLTGKRPFPNSILAPRTHTVSPIEYNPRVSSSLAQCILKALEPSPEARYQSAAEMQTALNIADWEPIPPPTLYAGFDLSLVPLLPEEVNKPNYNPYLTRLLTLYSQSRRTNAGTRGLDAFARATYVPTRLDRALEPAILSGDYALVIITGNAGDGKTAFIQKVEAEIRQEPSNNFHELETKNGARFTYQGKQYWTNYDGSQDEGNVNNDQVLRTFFEAFKDNDPIKAIDRVHVIAINEGRLMDFLQTWQDEFSYLYRQVRDFFELEAATDPKLLVINLNLRSVVASGDDSHSILDQMLERLSAPALWEKCRECDIADRCYAKFNADSLNDQNYGPQIRTRIKSLFEIAHLRRRLHLTIRDLRSALAYMIAGTLDCDEIHSMVKDAGQSTEYLAGFYFNAPFDFGFPNRTTQDRLLRLLAEVDPGQVANPRLDAELAFVPQHDLSIFPPFDSRSQSSYDLLEIQRNLRNTMATFLENQENQVLFDHTQISNVENLIESNAARYHIALRRQVYFERLDEGWQEMLPYSRYNEFLELVTKQEPAKLEMTRDALVHAISLSEGIFGDMGREYLCLRTSQDPRVTIKSFRRFRKDRFRCRVLTADTQGRYIEYLPSNLILEYNEQERANIRLEIGLDLYEMLYHIRQGYTASLNELRGSFVSLLIFKRQLASTRYDEVLLTQDEELYFQVYESSEKKLVLTQLK